MKCKMRDTTLISFLAFYEETMVAIMTILILSAMIYAKVILHFCHIESFFSQVTLGQVKNFVLWLLTILFETVMLGPK